MSFWGVEVKPGKPYIHHNEIGQGRIQITQATLGTGSSTKKSTVQCNVADKSPIFLCTLLPERIESCPLHLEFEDDDEVTFSVIGPRSVHLSGFSVSNDQDFDGDDDPFGEDIAETETEESTEYDTEDEYEDDFIDDDDIEMFPPSPVPNSGVLIEEILDDEKPANGNAKSKPLVKKSHSKESDDDDYLQRQIIVKSDAAVQGLVSEDEDGFPIPDLHKNESKIQKAEEAEEMTDKRTEEPKKKKKTKNDSDSVTNLKRRVDTPIQDDESKRKKKKKTAKEQNQEAKACEYSKDKKTDAFKEDEVKLENANVFDVDQAVTAKNENIQSPSNEKNLGSDVDLVAGENHCEDKKKRKKKKKKAKTQVSEGDANMKQISPGTGDEHKSSEVKPFQVRTFGNGLVVEELAMGKPDGKKASPGNKVSVHYIGKLQKNGQIFDSNIGSAPFKFRLGVNQVIKGWDVGVKGMRIGDKRRLTIPPSMAYGAKRQGTIPPNSTLVFDVELVGVH
ncbi:peptidyl-prolyl cis-trans isomerase FKBP53 [Malania oleifera]|uniref:peptidyl-prolyl cis-trans isomerase FKBP53 n=1 Tax=Malania oleifera TaxID=397392 RepID=UPI0025ADC865|nr:peptidyl-prolyl cis-trans isomerase FKBP53 [Malania oleifera]